MKKTLLLLVSIMLCTFLQAKSDNEKTDKSVKTVPQMYAYAVGTSPKDSVVYMTDLLILKNAQMTRKTNFLVGRQDLSAQFRNHLADINQPDRTCATMFAVDYKKASKDYDKLKRNLEKKGFDVKIIDQTEFRFIVTTR